MMKTTAIETLRELLVANLQTMHYAELQFMKSIPVLKAFCGSAQLAAAMSAYETKIEDKTEKLEQVFGLLGCEPKGWESDMPAAIMEHSLELLKHIQPFHVRDAAVIANMQRIIHLMVTDYGTASAFAGTLAMEEVAAILHRILEDEKSSDREFSRLAENNINPEAKGLLMT